MSDRYVANFSLTPNEPMVATFQINVKPSKLSELENDVGYITADATHEAIAEAVADKPSLITLESPSLTSQYGICSWTFENPLNTTNISLTLIETESGLNEIPDYAVSDESITVNIGSLNNLEAGVYKIILIGIERMV